MKNAVSRIFYWFLGFLQVQLFITLVSLPMLIGWGLPISLLAPIGNLLFAPFLIAFLFLASALFFLELAHLPNEWLIFLLEKVVIVWKGILSYNYPSWLISFSRPSWIVLTILITFPFIVVLWRTLHSMIRRIGIFSMIIIFIFIGLKWKENHEAPLLSIPCCNGAITAFKVADALWIIDPGYSSRCTKPISWINYSLMPALNTYFGSSNIEHLVLLQPGFQTFEFAISLLKTVSITNVYLPVWSGLLEKRCYKKYRELIKIIKEKNISLHRFNTQKKIPLSKETFEMLPLDYTLSYKEITFPAYKIVITIDNKTTTIYSAKVKMHENNKEITEEF